MLACNSTVLLQQQKERLNGPLFLKNQGRIFTTTKEGQFYQGSKGIGQWPINCGISSIKIHKITSYVDYIVSGWNVWTHDLMNQLIKI